MCVILAAARIKRERRTALEEKKRRRFDAGRREEEEGEHRAMLFATLRASLRHHQIIRGHEDEMKEEGVKDCKASRATNQCVWDEFRLCLVYCVTFDLRVGCDEEQEEKECLLAQLNDQIRRYGAYLRHYTTAAALQLSLA